MNRKLDIYRGLTIADAGAPISHLADEKPLGLYLMEAGLLTPAQVEVALNDQKMTGLRFGQVIALRGWVKQQTIDYLMQKIIIPERQAYLRQLRHPTYVQVVHTPSEAEEITMPLGGAATPQQLTPSNEPNFAALDSAAVPPPPPGNDDFSDEEISWVG